MTASKRRLNERRRIVVGCRDDRGMPPSRQDSICGLLFFDFGAFRPVKMLVFGRRGTPANTMDTGERCGAGKPPKSGAVLGRPGRQNAQDRVLERWRAAADFGRWVGVAARVLSGGRPGIGTKEETNCRAGPRGEGGRLSIFWWSGAAGILRILTPVNDGEHRRQGWTCCNLEL